MQQEEKIHWDKLLRHLEGKVEDEDELNQEELDMLLLAEEIHMRLQEKNPRLRFPVEEGWEELLQRHEAQTRRNSKYRIYRMLMAAAVVLMVLAPAWWLFFYKNESLRASSPDEIQLTLSSGEIVELDSNKSTVLHTEGAALNGTNVVYKRETNNPAPHEQVHTNVLTVPRGKYSRLELSDGTVVYLNSGSKLSFPVPFEAHMREVDLEGEAFFKVSHNASRPFVVRLKAMNVKVLGTAFSINTFGKTINTALEQGKVSLLAGKQSLLLQPGEVGTYSTTQGLSKSEEDLRLYTAWKDHDIYFDNNTLEEIAARLEREYNVSFVFEQPGFKDLHFTVDMEKQAGLQKILSNIRFSSDQIDFLTKGNTIYIRKR